MVESFSSLLYIRNEHRVPIHRNHSDLVKFALRGDSDYLKVVRRLKEWLEELTIMENDGMYISIQSMSLSHYIPGDQLCSFWKTPDLNNLESIRCFLKALDAPKYEHFRKENVKDPVSGTLEWFREEPLYLQWVNASTDSFLWIRGAPGQGKTVLSKSVLSHLDNLATNTAPGTVKIIYFFFCKDFENFCSVNSILRALIEQLLKGSVRLCQFLFDFIDDATKIIKSDDMLWEIFEDLIGRSHCNTIYCVIDGIDECEKGNGGSTMSILLQRLRGLSDSKSDVENRSSPILKILLASRHDPSISDALSGVPYFDLRVRVADLEKFVEMVVSQLPRRFSEDCRRTVLELLRGKAERTFVWVSLIVKDIRRIIMPTVAGLKNIITKSPPDLDGLYRDIFDKIFEFSDEEEIPQKLIAWVVYARRPLTITELDTAIAIQLDSRDLDSLKNHRPHLHPEFLVSTLGIILEMTDNNLVHLIHQSARDFILDQNILCRCSFTAKLRPELYIAQSCMIYVTFRDFQEENINIRTSATLGPLAKLLTNDSFLHYAIHNWHSHIQEENDFQRFPGLLRRMIAPSSAWRRVSALASPVPLTSPVSGPLTFAIDTNREWLAIFILNDEIETSFVSAEELEYAATHCSLALLELAFKKCGLNEEFVIRGFLANRNARGNPIEGLSRATITKALVHVALQNWVTGDVNLKNLIKSGAEFTEEAANWIIQNCDADAIALLMARQPFTSSMIPAAARNKAGAAIMRSLVSGARSRIDVGVDTILAAAASQHTGTQIIGVFLTEPGITFTTEALVEFLSSDQFEHDVKSQLLKTMRITVDDDMESKIAERKRRRGIGTSGRGLRSKITMEQTLSQFLRLAPQETAILDHPKTSDDLMNLIENSEPKHMLRVIPFIDSLSQYARAIEVFTQPKPEILSFLWVSFMHNEKSLPHRLMGFN